MKKTACARLLAALWIWMVFACLPLSAEVLQDQLVYDHAELFTAQKAFSLEEQAQIAANNTGYAFVIVTTNDTGGKTPMAFADDFYDDMGFGSDKDASGVLLLIDMQHREIYISTTGAMIDILTDARIDRLLDDVYEYVAAQDYAGGAAAFLQGARAYAEQGVPAGQYRQDIQTGEITPSAHTKKIISVQMLLLALAVGLAGGGGAVWCVSHSYRNGPDAYTYPYREKNRMHLRVQNEHLVNRYVTTRKIPKSSGGCSSSSSGRSSTHRSSSGRSHGGGGRRF